MDLKTALKIYFMDFSSRASDLFKKICPRFPKDQILIGDFFSLKKPLFFDVIIEQTFFCAIDPLKTKLHKKN